MPQRMRHVLPLSAGGPAGGARVLPHEPPGRAREGQGAGAVLRPRPEEGVRVVRVPGRQEVQGLRPQDRLLQAVPVPSLRQRPHQGRAGPLLQRGLDRGRRRRPDGGQGHSGQGGQEDRLRAGGVHRRLPRVLRQLQGGRGHGGAVRSEDVRLREPLDVHRPGLWTWRRSSR